MVVHVVCIKFRDFADVEPIARQLEALPAHIPEIRRSDVGRDFSRSPRSYDLVAVSEFDSRGDLQAYRDHPAHADVGAAIAAAADEIAVVDFER